MKHLLTFLILAGAALAQVPTSADAIDALRALKSVTEIGINFRDYSVRVLDAKVKVDKYLADAPKDDAARPGIESAMRLHVLASQLWANKIQRYSAPAAIGDEIMASPEFSTCADMPQWIEKAKNQKPFWQTSKFMNAKQKAFWAARDQSTPATYLAMSLEDNPGVLWRCAAGILEGLKK